MYQDCINLYLHKGGLSNQAISEGKTLHKKWEKEIKKTNRLKVGKTELFFNEPDTEYKFYVPYNELADLSCVIDCLDRENENWQVFEWKSGIESSTTYASGYQIPFYFLALDLARIKVKSALLLHYNQHENKEDTTPIHNGVKTMERAKNYIDSLLYGVYELIKSANAL
jgi:hypothetical protein